MKIKNKYLLIFSATMLIILVGIGCADTDEETTQAFNFTEIESDFGVIKQSGEKVSHEFELKTDHLDEYLEPKESDILEIKASKKVEYIEFDAFTITNNNVDKLAEEYGSELKTLAINMNKTNVLLIMNNHRIDLSEFDFKIMSKLDNLSSEEWQSFSEAMGGHHVAGVITFAKNPDPKLLTIEGLPVDKVELNFKNI